MLLQELLHNSARKHANKLAVIHQNSRLTYSELDNLSDSLALKIIQRCINKGDRVILFLENSAEYLIAYFAVLKAGAVVVPLNTQLVEREIAHYITDSQPSLVITADKYKNLFESYMTRRGILTTDELTQILHTQHSETHLLYKQHPNAYNENDLAMIIYTSGTTGKPKGVMLSHANIHANADSIMHYLDIRTDDRMMVILPFYYSYGNSILTTHIMSGATMVLDNRFVFPNTVLETMEKEKATGFAGVPSHYAILLRKSALRKYKLESLRYVTQAGGAMAPSMIEEFTAAVPQAKFYVMYGQTEASARLTYLDPRALKSKLGSIGKAIPGVEIDVITEAGSKAGPGEMGEIVARGANIMLGYWNSPQETANVLKKDGLYTGDLAKVDEDGYLYMVSRKKEMIKSGANRISPFEIEDVVCRMPGVLECAAVGIADEILGEAIKLCVVKNGVPFNENDLLLFCKKNLASFKMPKVVEFVESLPKTSTGKLKRDSLKMGPGPEKKGSDPIKSG